MTNFTDGRWLLVVLALLGLALVAPVVTAHGTGTTTDGAHAYDRTGTGPTDWNAWMASHMTDHAGPGGVEWMESHMGATVDEMGAHVSDGNVHGPGMYGEERGC